mmetsp:Transcript_26345/g.57201  ORF Transcript_26345/g.57201 Transcript_26345/m.57201 type:complete len:235 (-) Transcript_26345:31-735(-)
MPRTSSKFDKMEPIKDCCTTPTRPALMALMVTIISTALPKVALRRPPTICPTCAAKASVEAPSTAARGTIAKKFKAKVGKQPHSRMPEAMPRGTHTSRTLIGCIKMFFRPETCFWHHVCGAATGMEPSPARGFVELSSPLITSKPRVVFVREVDRRFCEEMPPLGWKTPDDDRDVPLMLPDMGRERGGGREREWKGGVPGQGEGQNTEEDDCRKECSCSKCGRAGGQVSKAQAT